MQKLPKDQGLMIALHQSYGIGWPRNPSRFASGLLAQSISSSNALFVWQPYQRPEAMSRETGYFRSACSCFFEAWPCAAFWFCFMCWACAREKQKQSAAWEKSSWMLALWACKAPSKMKGFCSTFVPTKVRKKKSKLYDYLKFLPN